ncbi:hypothetical protein AWE51_19585 [Aquimarina aggregata]|uniref:Uncharacterized protein n=1 Tax=Aquimarina aggregata TaxID=1642818 RepID=A0A162WQD9_9FLAO|nr:hypothetical protein AWE51_19585 [Aquimarina aggregata]
MDKTLMYMIFFVVLVVLLWMMPDKKINTIRKLLTSLLQVLPITKVAEACIAYFKNKNASKAE